MDTGTLSKHGGAEMLATDNSESGNLPLETKEELVSQVELSVIKSQDKDLEDQNKYSSTTVNQKEQSPQAFLK